VIIPFDYPIYVTRPFLPPLDDFKDGLNEIWENRWLTNEGPILKRYEKELSEYLKNDNLSIFSNGTLALQLAIQALGIEGEVITTPFTFVATTHALFWNNIKPVFCDIEDKTFNIDVNKIEEKITSKTTAILAVHVFGNPCDVVQLAKIAKKHNLSLIYDAAHAFNVEIGGEPISNFGDISMFSFHATKLYHSFEGGMLSFKDSTLKKKLSYLKNFGFESEIEVVMPGTNAKMNEVQALMGSKVLKHIDDIVIKRQKISDFYRKLLFGIEGISFIDIQKGVKSNYAYMPILVEEKKYGITRDELYDRLRKYNVYTRKYFYPLIPDLQCYKGLNVAADLPVARRIASQVLTLPIYHDLELTDVDIICNLIKKRCLV
jgi:dTDP-4-amino-4,6-dideoxygalactose transaminase